MASGGSYPDPDAAQAGGASAGLYVNNQNGGMSPPQPQHQQVDPELQLQENLSQHLSRSAMMSAGPPQENPMNTSHHHLQTPNRPTHSPQQMAQTVMNLEDHAPYGEHPDVSSSQRKRSKVSRACDECRRKKIRCDATSENGPEACSSCKRTGARCQFSRQPMKRGPSKGYIKELADRLNTLESQIANPHPPPQPGYDIPYVGMGDQGLSGLPDMQTPTQYSRKRTHSISEGLQDPYGPGHRPAMGWSGQDSTQRALVGDQYSPNGAAQGGYRRMSNSFGDIALAGSLIQGSNEGVLKAYYHLIHPTLPILAADSSSLNRLTGCPAGLRDAFFQALECAVRSFSASGLPQAEVSIVQLLHRTLDLVEKAQHTLDDGDSARRFYNHLVYTQSLAFLAFASDKSGPGAMNSSAELLGRTAGRISQLGLNDAKMIQSVREQDPEAVDVARRLFWTVFILDRFHASSMSKDLLMPLFCGSVSRDDFNALGEIGYHLARASDIVGQIAYLIRTNSIPNIEPQSPHAFATMTSTSAPSLYLNGQLARFKESLDLTNLLGNSPPHLAYQYLRIIVARLSLFTAPSDILALTKELMTNLIHPPISPLNHILGSLVATSLTELADRPETQLEALNAIAEMDDAIANGSIVHRGVEGPGWDAAIRDLLHQKKAPSTEQQGSGTQPNMAGLQHLAAAAVGEREGTDAGRPASSGGNGAPTETKNDVTAAVAAASEAAVAQATAAAAQKQLQNSAAQSYDPTALVKDGFMSSLG